MYDNGIYELRDDEEVGCCIGGPRFAGAMVLIRKGTDRVYLPYIPDIEFSFLAHSASDTVETCQDEYTRVFTGEGEKVLFRYVNPEDAPQ